MGPKVANEQLAIMWRRFFPQIFEKSLYWFFYSVEWVNYKIPGFEKYIVGDKIKLQHLLELAPPYLTFTNDEEILGQAGLREIGLPSGVEFVCLLVRDNVYLSAFQPKVDDSVSEFRNCDVNDFILAAEELTRQGYYVIRMGAKVAKKIKTKNEKIIDYATSPFRNDFMD